MTLKKLDRDGVARRCHRLLTVRLTGQAPVLLDPAVDSKAARRFVADLFGRLHRPALQRADAGRTRRRSRTSRSRGRRGSPAATRRRRRRGRARFRRRRLRRSAAARRAGDRRRRGHRRVPGRRERHRQGRDPPGQRHPLRHGARQRLGDGRARRPRALALLLEDEGRHAHRQPRRRDVEQLPVLRDARQLPRLARRAHRQGTLARRDRRLRSAVLLDDGADRRRQPRARRHRQRPRRARLPAVVTIRRPASASGSSTPCR